MSWDLIALSELVEFPPKVSLEKNELYDNIPMDVVNSGIKYVQEINQRVYTGGGAKFGNGDTIFARITPCLENGKISKVKGLEKGVGFGSTEFFVFRAKENISDPDFIYYLAKTDLVRQPAIKSMVGASGRQRADKGVVEQIKVPKIPLPTQRKIASILSAYDDLIENNLKRIKLLEEAANHKYKQFKNETFDTWISGQFSDFFKINNGCAFKAEWYAESGIPIVRTRDYSYSKFLRIEQPIFIDDFQSDNFKKFNLKEYDFMLIMVGASIGRYGIILPKDLPALQNQNQWALRELEKFNYLKVVKLFLLEEILSNLLQQRTGAARDFFRASFLNEIEVKVPKEKEGVELNAILEKYFEQINVIQKLNSQLISARDILLPRLMSGQIEV